MLSHIQNMSMDSWSPHIYIMSDLQILDMWYDMIAYEIRYNKKNLKEWHILYNSLNMDRIMRRTSISITYSTFLVQYKLTIHVKNMWRSKIRTESLNLFPDLVPTWIF